MRPTLLAAAAASLALSLSGCVGTHTSGVIAQPQRGGSASSLPSPAAPGSAATALPPGSSPSSSPSPSAPPAPTYDVKAVQRQLTDLHYYLSGIDGAYGPSLQSAVMAFQKVQGIGADGVIGPATLAALSKPQLPALKASSPADRVEVDLTKQVLYVVKGGALVRILPVSSGNGATYLQKNGGTATALSPVGWYRIERRIIGPQKADLGTLYDPQYFYRGWAIHGSDSVPAYPASHGCIRVTRPDAKYLLQAINVGMPVYLYGGRYTFTAGSSAPGTDNPTGDTSPSGVASSPSPSGRPSPGTSSPGTSPAPAPSSSPSAAASPAATSPTAHRSPTPSPSHTA